MHTRFTTRRLLVTEWVEGSTPDAADLKEEEAKEMAQLGGQAVFRQIVGTGFFHADPHAGNLLITQIIGFVFSIGDRQVRRRVKCVINYRISLPG